MHKDRIQPSGSSVFHTEGAITADLYSPAASFQAVKSGKATAGSKGLAKSVAF